jgi:hypothetical protein
MITRRAFTAAVLGLASCENDSKGSAPYPVSTGNLMDPKAWTIGPDINGQNYSVGMPLNPAPHSEGWSFDIPQAPGSVHYVTAPYGSLTGKGALVLGSVRARANKYRLCWDEANPGSCGLQDGQHGRSPPEVEQSAAVGGNMLMVAGARAEEVAQFVVSPAEPGC